MTLRLTSLALCSLALLACAGNVAVSNTGGGTTTGTGGTGGDTGGAGGGTGGGPIGMCTRTNDGFHYTLTPTGGKSIDCNSVDPGGSTKAHIEGIVTATSATSLSIDTCPPNADCDASALYELKIQSPGFAMNVLPGSFVQIDVQIDFPWGCANTIMGRNLPVWQGLSSTGGDVPWLIFAASDGAQHTLDGAPFTLGTTALGCHPDAPVGCGKEDEHRFDVTATSSVAVPVYQGETKSFSVHLAWGMQTLLFRNLRSYETGWCDDYWNWAYWAVPAPPVD